MKKILILISLLLMLVGCSQTETVELDLNALYQQLMTSGYFDEELEAMSDNLIVTEYNNISYTEAKVATNAGANANQIALFKFEDVDQGYETLKYYLENLETNYASYQPEEVKKIENATFIKKGNYVLLVIGDDYQSIADLVNNFIEG